MNGKQWVSIAGLGLFVIAFAIYFFFPGYGAIGEKAYQFSVAIDSACSREDQATLEKIDQQMTAATTAAELNARETSWLRGILELAQDKRWQEARQACRKLQEAQLVDAQ